MSEDEVMLSTRIPEELKKLVDADGRNNQEIVKAALWREFGGRRKAALERRAEEIENRLNMVERERNERTREIEQLESDLEAVRGKLQARQSTKDELLTEARDALEHAPMDPENPAIQNWAEKLELSPDELVTKLEPDQ